MTFGDYLLVLNMARADCLLFPSSGRNFDIEDISESCFKFDKFRRLLGVFISCSLRCFKTDFACYLGIVSE